MTKRATKAICQACQSVPCECATKAKPRSWVRWMRIRPGLIGNYINSSTRRKVMHWLVTKSPA